MHIGKIHRRSEMPGSAIRCEWYTFASMANDILKVVQETVQSAGPWLLGKILNKMVLGRGKKNE